MVQTGMNVREAACYAAVRLFVSLGHKMNARWGINFSISLSLLFPWNGKVVNGMYI